MSVVFLLTRTVSSLVSLLPLSFLYILSDITYFFVYYISGYRKQVVRENLSFAFPEKSKKDLLEIEKSFYRYFCDLNFEILKIPGLSVKELNRRVHFKNPEIIDAYKSKNQSMIAVTAHLNNWEWGGLALSHVFNGVKILGVYKPLTNPKFDQYFRGLRSRFGMELVSMKSTLRAILKNRDKITLTTLISDQTPTIGETEFVTSFMGRVVPVYLGAEKISKHTKYPVFYLAMRAKKRGYYEVEAIPISDHPEQESLYEITKKHVRILEKEILRQPSNWLWSHRRWKHSGKTWPEEVVVG